MSTGACGCIGAHVGADRWVEGRDQGAYQCIPLKKIRHEDKQWGVAAVYDGAVGNQLADRVPPSPFYEAILGELLCLKLI